MTADGNRVQRHSFESFEHGKIEAMTEPTELETAVAQAIAEALYQLPIFTTYKAIFTTYKAKVGHIVALDNLQINTASLARAAIAECFKWRPIEEAEPRIRDTDPPAFGEHVIRLSYSDRDAEMLILLFWDQDEHRWSKWMSIPPPEDEP